MSLRTRVDHRRFSDETYKQEYEQFDFQFFHSFMTTPFELILEKFWRARPEEAPRPVARTQSNLTAA